MKVIVISYSFTGNNEALASTIAEELGAEHVKITEPKSRNMGSIIVDMLFNRTPQINPIKDKTEDNDLILFVGPVWMGQAAAPFRAYFRLLKARPGQQANAYAYISISGGALGPNHKLAGDLKKRIGKEPAAVIDLHIADLLPSDPKPKMKVTSSYRLNDRDVKSLTGTIVKTLRETISK